jgi:hypothetical protein
VDESYYNLIENNIFAYGGHHTLGIYSKYNVIRYNYFHNETNPANWNFEGYRASITEGEPGGRCLYEGNKYGFPDASGMALRTPKNIFRFNTFYRNGHGGIQVVSSQAGADHADSNRIYHNSFYHNGHLATDPGFQGGMYFANWSGVSPVGNIVKNNIFYDNKNGSISYEGQVDSQVIENNWDQNDVDPGFVDTSGFDPNDPSLPDLHLVSNSPCIDSGIYLTNVISPGGSGTTFQVADAGYFMDGWSIPGVQGDEIQLYGSTQRAHIISVNYSTNTITVDGNITWVQNQGISLAYEDVAPDLGAYEYVEQPVVENEKTSAAARFLLYPGYPNPGEGGIRIKYALPKQGGVKLSIYNLVGREIRVLVDRTQEPGDYTISWDGTDNHGKEQPAGIYFIQFKSGKYKENKKVVLVKH